jgi:hypothetical protein
MILHWHRRSSHFLLLLLKMGVARFGPTKNSQGNRDRANDIATWLAMTLKWPNEWGTLK